MSEIPARFRIPGKLLNVTAIPIGLRVKLSLCERKYHTVHFVCDSQTIEIFSYLSIED